jgi:hypothetical protein
MRSAMRADLVEFPATGTVNDKPLGNHEDHDLRLEWEPSERQELWPQGGARSFS